MKINYSAIIDTAINAITEMGAYTKHGCKGKTQEEIRYLERYNYAGNQVISALADAIGCHGSDLYAAAHIASRWYNRTHWEICLSDDVAERLIESACAGLLRQEKPAECGRYSSWAKRRADRRAA